MNPYDLAYTIIRATLGAAIIYLAIRCIAIAGIVFYEAMMYPPI